MNKNKILTAVMAGTMIMGSTMPVFATESDPWIVEQTESGTSATRETEVYYTQSSTFTVTIPKTLVLDASRTAEYTVNVKGDVSSDKQVSVTPQDALTDVQGINFYMVDQATATNKKADVEATVIQDVTVWSSTDICKANGTDRTGNVSAPGLTSGSWAGTFEFSIVLEDAK